MPNDDDLPLFEDGETPIQSASAPKPQLAPKGSLAGKFASAYWLIAVAGVAIYLIFFRDTPAKQGISIPAFVPGRERLASCDHTTSLDGNKLLGLSDDNRAVLEDHSPLNGKYPPAEPGALGSEPLEAAVGVADAAPNYWAT